ncbi:hypothetical protein [Buttiauxella gaviniae]|uniref:hypothetical protein n=1 Tax=Buttiauxella gaviniae TaxID=82990 RepID=UPI003C7284A1
MNTKTQELVTAGYALAKGLDAEHAKLVKELATELAVQRVRADELNKRSVNLAVENASLKSNLMFWDADNPELPYDSPEEIASECELNYNEELVVQVAAKLPNRTYRVCESWEIDCKLELVEGTELQTPATDVAIANIRASEAKEIYESILDNPAVTDMGSLVDWIESYANNSISHAAQLRREADNA